MRVTSRGHPREVTVARAQKPVLWGQTWPAPLNNLHPVPTAPCLDDGRQRPNFSAPPWWLAFIFHLIWLSYPLDSLCYRGNGTVHALTQIAYRAKYILTRIYRQLHGCLFRGQDAKLAKNTWQSWNISTATAELSTCTVEKPIPLIR